jgi:hypothetical protein
MKKILKKPNVPLLVGVLTTAKKLFLSDTDCRSKLILKQTKTILT